MMLDDSKKQLNDVTFHDIGWLDVFFLVSDAADEITYIIPSVLWKLKVIKSRTCKTKPNWHLFQPPKFLRDLFFGLNISHLVFYSFNLGPSQELRRSRSARCRTGGVVWM